MTRREKWFYYGSSPVVGALVGVGAFEIHHWWGWVMLLLGVMLAHAAGWVSGVADRKVQVPEKFCDDCQCFHYPPVSQRGVDGPGCPRYGRWVARPDR